MGRVPSARVALMMMAAAGVLTVFSWGASSLTDDVFKLLPGFTVPLAVYAISELVTKIRSRRHPRGP